MNKNNKKMFTENLPKWEIGQCKEKINWGKTVGYKVPFIYDDIIGKVEIINYDSKTRKLEIKYKDNYKMINYSHFCECKIGSILKKRTSEFKVEIGKRFKDDKRDITIIDREIRKINKNNRKKENQKWYKYHCNKCGWNEGWIVESVLLHEAGCSCCAGHVVVEGINDIPTTAPWMVKYFQGGYDEAKLYTKNGGGNPNNRYGYIYPICPDCGRVKKKEKRIADIYKNHSIGCQCGDKQSYISKYMFNILEQLKEQKQIIEFQTEKKYEWGTYFNSFKQKNTYGIYDFVLEDIKLIIETDGGFHRIDNNLNEQTKEESIFIDNEKDKLANEHGYKMIRISDEGNIKQNIIESDLNELFDLNNIDWLKAEEFALSNRVKEACEYKKNNPEFTTTDIAKIMNMSSKTIKDYLKKGNDLNWCHYDANEESLKIINKNKISSSKPIKVFKESILIGMFSSITELERQSEKLFGVKLYHASISAVCRGEKQQYKGYIFEYVNTNFQERM